MGVFSACIKKNNFLNKQFFFDLTNSKLELVCLVSFWDSQPPKMDTPRR